MDCTIFFDETNPSYRAPCRRSSRRFTSGASGPVPSKAKSAPRRKRTTAKHEVISDPDTNRESRSGYDQSVVPPNDLPTKPPIITGPTGSTATTAESAKIFTAEEVKMFVAKEVLAMQDKMLGYFCEQDRRQREVMNHMQDRQAATDARIMFLLQALLQSNAVPQQTSEVAAASLSVCDIYIYCG